jgi:hypothetical protein
LDNKFLGSLDLKNPSGCIKRMREKLWTEYLLREKQSILPCLLEAFNAQKTGELNKVLDQELEKITNMRGDLGKEQKVKILLEAAAHISSEAYTEIYEISKSYSQARRSRAGQEFQSIISILMRLYGFQYDNQAKLGKGRFMDIGLKMVDGIFPGIDEFSVSKQNCCVLTLKTTLRERWQEVVDEIKRVNIPSIYLLTLDSSITAGMLHLMHEHNILLVTLKEIKDQFSRTSHIFSFEEFFGEVLPEKQKWWGRQSKN